MRRISPKPPSHPVPKPPSHPVPKATIPLPGPVALQDIQPTHDVKAKYQDHVDQGMALLTVRRPIPTPATAAIVVSAHIPPMRLITLATRAATAADQPVIVIFRWPTGVSGLECLQRALVPLWVYMVESLGLHFLIVPSGRTIVSIAETCAALNIRKAYTIAHPDTAPPGATLAHCITHLSPETKLTSVNPARPEPLAQPAVPPPRAQHLYMPHITTDGRRYISKLDSAGFENPPAPQPHVLLEAAKEVAQLVHREIVHPTGLDPTTFLPFSSPQQATEFLSLAGPLYLVDHPEAAALADRSLQTNPPRVYPSIPRDDAARFMRHVGAFGRIPDGHGARWVGWLGAQLVLTGTLDHLLDEIPADPDAADVKGPPDPPHPTPPAWSAWVTGPQSPPRPPPLSAVGRRMAGLRVFFTRHLLGDPTPVMRAVVAGVGATAGAAKGGGGVARFVWPGDADAMISGAEYVINI